MNNGPIKIKEKAGLAPESASPLHTIPASSSPEAEQQSASLQRVQGTAGNMAIQRAMTEGGSSINMPFPGSDTQLALSASTASILPPSLSASMGSTLAAGTTPGQSSSSAVSTLPTAPVSKLEESTAQVPSLPPEVVRQLAYAETVLRRVEPLPKAQEDRLNQIIGDTPIYEMIRKRNEKRSQIDQDQQALADYRGRNFAVARGEQLSGGAPASQDVLDYLTNEIATLSSEVEQLNINIQATLKVLGVGSEEEMLYLVEVEFPEIWINRAKQIAYSMLDENRDRIQHEKERYPANISSIDIEGLRTADENLNTLALDLQDLSKKAEQAAAGSPSGGVPENWKDEDTNFQLIEKRVKAKQEEIASQRQIYGAKYPVLLLPNYKPGSFVNAQPQELEMLTGSWLQEVLEHIETTRQNIATDKIKVWNLRDIPSLTFQNLGVAENSVLGIAVKKYIEGEESDEASLKIAIAVLQVGLVILATAVAGPLGGALVGATFTLDQLAEHVNQYMAESAASQVAMDPVLADISVNEPQLLPIVLDVISLGLEVGAVMGALRPAARVLNETRDITEFARKARQVAPEAADELIVRAERRVAGSAVEEKESLARLFNKPTITGDPAGEAGTGFTDKFGNITYSTAGSPTDQALVQYHEQVHSFLSPKFSVLRNLRADFRIWAYNKSQFLKYLEEALAETSAQLRVNGLRGLPDGLAFPFTSGYYRLSITRVITEAAIGTVTVGGITYAVYVYASKE